MSSVRCHFCSRTNPPGAKFCHSCLVQLTLAPCPHCDEVNELSAPVCHACKAELVPASVERVSGGSPQPEVEPVLTAVDARHRSATRSMASGGLSGTAPQTYASAQDA